MPNIVVLVPELLQEELLKVKPLHSALSISLAIETMRHNAIK